ncbi:heterokaryon incompatibility protein-domain-containing protein [Xylaria arbuscula]|nr:heterokaryon incompatibility protein-domain-containing protein [Xylaria arbuscula]
MTEDYGMSQTCSQSYTYRPITSDQIRVAEIHPGESDDPVAITIHHERFVAEESSEAHLVAYEALSYVWGSTENMEPILADNLELSTTRNLNSALKHLRYQDESRFMWIDALCIDQGNEIEKGPCVAMMGDIYRRASRVVVWLGEAENDSTEAIDLLKWMGERVDVNFFRQLMRPSSDFEPDCTVLSDRTQPLPFDEDEHFSLHALFCRPWFDRLWVRQEIGLANQASAVVSCGNRTIPWLTFKRAWACYYLKPSLRGWGHNVEFAKRKTIIRRFLFQDNNGAMPNLRFNYGHVQCADQRDRIFGLLNLETQLRDIGVVPDYTKRTHLEVYDDVTRRYLSHYKGLDILSECELRNTESAKSTGSSTPSWIPDWSTGNPYVQALDGIHRYASGCLTGPKSQIEQQRLPIIAIPIDTIKNIHHHDLQVTNLRPEAQFVIQNLATFIQLNKDYPSGGSVLEAYASTLVTGIFSDSYVTPPQGLFSKEDAIRVINKLVQSGTQASSLQVVGREQACVDLMKGFLIGRALFTTETGYIGIASKSVAPGDEVCVILGCNALMVLRPTTEDSEERLVVGPCYMEGFNNGEAVLGPLPDGIEKKVFHDGQFSFITFGDGEVIDPRLEGWIDSTQADNIRDSSKQGIKFQTLEADLKFLERGGVHNAQYIYLV